jgi:4-hydroxybenzoate polyprenyltransferase
MEGSRATVRTEAAGERSPRTFPLVKALRPHQWVKNLLVFAPLALAGRFDDVSAVASTLLAFVAIGMIASGTYLINDMWDLLDDRAHWSKRHRPLASGLLPISHAASVAPLAIAVGLAAGTMVSLEVVGFLLLYVVVTLAYTFGLKRIRLIDGLVLAVLYTIRVALGIVAAGTGPSLWLLVFSMFFFASLTFAKRYTEIAGVVGRNGDLVNGRGYRAVDAPLVLTIGVVAGVGAVLAMHFYLIEDAFAQSFYRSPMALWGFPPLLLLLITRIWLKSYRGEMDDDPVHFVLKDRGCMVLAALMAACFSFAWLGPNWS